MRKVVDTTCLKIRVFPISRYAAQKAATKGPQVHKIGIVEGFGWIYKRQNSGVWEIVREKVPQPHLVVFRPGLRVLRAQTVDGNDTLEAISTRETIEAGTIRTPRLVSRASLGRCRLVLLSNRPRMTCSPSGVSVHFRHFVERDFSRGILIDGCERLV